MVQNLFSAFSSIGQGTISTGSSQNAAVAINQFLSASGDALPNNTT
jgi:hypothetical protein